MPSAGSSRIGQSDRPVILHVSGDFPDPVEPFKTPVIRQLVELTGKAFEHRVISINRVSPSRARLLRSLLPGDDLALDKQDFEFGCAVRYHAPGKGVRHRTKLSQLGDWIASEIETMDRAPHLIIGHKLTIEGIAVRIASERSGIPYALSIQGNTDLKIIRTRRDLKPLFGKIFHDARAVFPFAPWALAQVEELLGKRAGPTFMLPCPTELDQPTVPKVDGDGLISVFHLKNSAIKNLTGVVEAYRHIARSGGTPPALEIIGGGSDAEVAACKAITADFPQISFAGPMDREPLRARMNRASAMVMPSLRESFGLVFIEALFAGTPIIYPARTAIDGYFDGDAFAQRVDAGSPKAIADAMLRAIEQEQAMKEALAAWQHGDEAHRFTREAIAEQFATGIRSGLTVHSDEQR